MENSERQPSKPSHIGELLGGLLDDLQVAKKNRVTTPEQELALEIATFFDEQKKIGMWMKIVKKHGHNLVRREWKGLSDYPKPYTGKLLVWKLKQHGTKRTEL